MWWSGSVCRMRSSAVQPHAAVSAVIWAVRLWWVVRTPLGRPVVPEVWMSRAGVEGWGWGGGGAGWGEVEEAVGGWAGGWGWGEDGGPRARAEAVRRGVRGWVGSATTTLGQASSSTYSSSGRG